MKPVAINLTAVAAARAERVGGAKAIRGTKLQYTRVAERLGSA